MVNRESEATREVHAVPMDWRHKFIYLPDIIEMWMSEYGGFEGKRVLDFGCGEGATVLGLALRKGVESVWGVDIMDDVGLCVEHARDYLGIPELPQSVTLEQVIPGELGSAEGPFDVVYSWSVFEHINEALVAPSLDLLRSKMVVGGLLFIQIAPLYFSSEGSHAFHLVPERWGHLVHQHDEFVSRIRERAGSSRDAENVVATLESLNRMTADELIGLVEKAGFEIMRVHRTYEDFEIPTRLLGSYREQVLRENQIALLAKR